MLLLYLIRDRGTVGPAQMWDDRIEQLLDNDPLADRPSGLDRQCAPGDRQQALEQQERSFRGGRGKDRKIEKEAVVQINRMTGARSE